MSASQTNGNIESTLPPPFRSGLDAIRTRVLPEVEVEVVADNFAWLRLGEYVLPEGLYTDSAAMLWARAPVNFPDAVPYGIATAPVLIRADAKVIDRQHIGHNTLPPLAAAVGRTDIAFYSWDWTNMPTRNGTDLIAIVEWARRRLRIG